MANGGNYTRPECKECRKKQHQVVNKLRKAVLHPDDDHTCPICGRTKDDFEDDRGNYGGWCLDHCHKTKGFRGWICQRCNLGLGNFKDDVEALKRAVEYLENTKPRKFELDLFGEDDD